MRTHRSLLKFAIAATVVAVGPMPAMAQQDYGYGYPQNSQPAAPSTIPGQGDSSARVPDVQPAPQYRPVPKKPRPQNIPWGGADSGARPAPPMTSQPPLGTPVPPAQPPVVRNDAPPVVQPGSTPPAGKPQVTVTPGQTTPPPSQPQGGANDRLAATYRGLGTNTAAVIRAGGATQGGGSAAGGSAMRTTSTVLACTQNGNTPKITRIRPANESSLQPGSTFIVEGLCFGEARGKVQVTLPTQYGRIQPNEAQILDWAGDKILAQLPDGVTKALPGDASVEVASSAGTRGAGRDIGFEPRWERTALKDVEGSVGACKVPNTPTTFHHCAVKVDGPRLIMKSTHSRGDTDLHPISAASDRYDLRMPDWMRPAGCSITLSSSTSDGAADGRATTRFEGKSAIVDWAFSAAADSEAFMTYDLTCDVWTPAGVVAQ